MTSLCNAPLVQAGNDGFCTKPLGHDGPCIEVSSTGHAVPSPTILGGRADNQAADSGDQVTVRLTREEAQRTAAALDLKAQTVASVPAETLRGVADRLRTALGEAE